MELQTQIPIKKEINNSISYDSTILLLGSCFSENIGNKFLYYKFQSVQNPFGILFHPKAIEQFITNTISEKIYTENELIYQNERWHCFDAHSSLSSSDKNELLTNLNLAISSTNTKLKKATHLIITLGTSWVYRFLETENIVANCHKIPQKLFSKELLSIDEIKKLLASSIRSIKNINPTISILFTVSPVRHLKDGFVQNQQSKSHLISAIHQLLNSDESNIFYFPSYEIMMDELRDYRFYSEDMIHPNQTAINYIWKKFIETWFSDTTKPTMQDVENIQKGMLHKAFNENSKQHQQFLKNLATKQLNLQKQFSWMQF